MRWWLALAFAVVAGLTAVAVVAVLSNRSERAFRTYAQEFAVGNTVAATEALKRVGSVAELRDEAAAQAERRHLALFVFDTKGRPMTPLQVAGDQLGRRSRAAARRSTPRSPATATSSAAATARPSSSASRSTAGPGGAVVAYSLRPDLREQLGIVRHEFLQSALLAFAVGAALGLLIATLIARRLARIARAAKAIGEGDFSVHTYDRFPDEVGSLAWSIERMRGQLEELFHALEQDRDRLERLLDRLNDGVLLIDRDLRVEYANGRARDLLGVVEHLDESPHLGGRPRGAAAARRATCSRPSSRATSA